MNSNRPLRLFFLRHGQTENFERHPFNGWLDAALTPLGRRQLDEAAEALAPMGFEAVYSSDLSRAVYGGEALAKKAGLDLQKDTQWREMSFDRWEGLTYAEMAAENPELLERIFSADGQGASFPEGESAAAFSRRVLEAFEKLKAKHSQGGSVALVCHGGVCKVLCGFLLGLAPEVAWRCVRQDYAAVNIFDIYPSGYIMAHLINGCAGADLLRWREHLKA